MLATSNCNYCLVRPSLLDGDGGFGASWIRALGRLPLHILPAQANGKIAALDVDDLGDALAQLVQLPIAVDAPIQQREFELGGLQVRDIADYMQAIRLARRPTPARRVRAPAWLVRLGSHVCDLLHFSPFSFGHWELLQHDNMPRHNRLAELLGRSPRPVGACQPSPEAIMPTPVPERPTI
jgi:NADH dehydrogenase